MQGGRYVSISALRASPFPGKREQSLIRVILPGRLRIVARLEPACGGVEAADAARHGGDASLHLCPMTSRPVPVKRPAVARSPGTVPGHEVRRTPEPRDEIFGITLDQIAPDDAGGTKTGEPAVDHVAALNPVERTFRPNPSMPLRERIAIVVLPGRSAWVPASGPVFAILASRFNPN
ncbi:hypothetical protein Maq22A_2p40165 (plasmid) [Methylobacterium aquaticum]|uniref:Uncharacterized protein n=1 Tax=Methylobacterium aquaticum TaxID=270351 RepID=A0A0C6FW80_9HYPH|nr:hypothetical protein Maq22A_2p40165 [Methylobacterium aquaticum]